MMNKITFPIGYYPVSAKLGVAAGGSLYIGQPGADPTIPANQKEVNALQENGDLVAISQPVTLSPGGLPLHNGSPVTLYVTGDYSMRVNDSLGAQLYYIPTSVQGEEDVVLASQLVGDGVTDNLDVFNAIEASGVTLIRIPDGVYYSSVAPTGHNVVYLLDPGASVVLGAGSWLPLFYRRLDELGTSQKVNFLEDNPTIPVEDYTILNATYEYNYWINQWGYQEPDTDGNLSGAFTAGKIPPGQTRLARSGAYQHRLRGLHSGEGDGYNWYYSMSATQHARTNLVTAWGGQNSAGIGGGQVAALSAKVNLYGIGDVVITDNGQEDVAMLGTVLYLRRTGADSGDYHIPRFGHYVISSGTADIEAAFMGTGMCYTGLDLSGGTFSSGSAIALSEGQRISFNADPPVPANGRFVTANAGTTSLRYQTSFTRLAVDNIEILRASSTRAEVNPAVNNNEAFRVYGSSTTAFAAMGQSNLVSYFSAFSSGTDSTVLSLRTALAGTERDVVILKSDGTVNMPLLSTHVDNAAALAAGKVAGDVYKTAAGELRIVV